MSAKKVALSLGIVFLIGLVIIALNGSLVTTLDGIWNWIFEDMLEIDDPPPSPFAGVIVDIPVYTALSDNVILYDQPNLG